MGSSLGVSTQPVLVGDRGVLILTAVCTPMACGLPGCRGGVSVHQLGPRWGGPQGAGEPKGQKVTLSPSTWAPGLGWWSWDPQVPRPFITWLSVCGSRWGSAILASQTEGGVHPSWGSECGLFFPSPLVRSLSFSGFFPK